MAKSLGFFGPIRFRLRAKISAEVILALVCCLAGCADDPGENTSQAGIPAFPESGGNTMPNGFLTGGVVASSSGGSNAAGSNATEFDVAGSNAAGSVAAGGTTEVADGSGGVSAAGSGGSSGLTGTSGTNALDAGTSGTGGTSEAVTDASDSVTAPHPSPWRIMLLGDSITETTCFPHLLWKKLHDNGRTNFDFVGTKINNQACGVSNPDQDCEGHGGYRVTELLPNGSHAAELPEWCSQDNAEIVLMHFGTNDAWSSVDTQQIIDAYSTVLAALRAVNPKVIVFIAQLVGLIPINTPECPNCACPTTCDEQVRTLNAAIPDWAETNSTIDSPIYMVDLYTGFDPVTDTRDGVHPNLEGAQKMADGWYNAIVALDLF